MALRSRAALQSQAAEQLRQARSSGRRRDWQAASALQQQLYHTRQQSVDADAESSQVGNVKKAHAPVHFVSDTLL
jgi:hypothetical protein